MCVKWLGHSYNTSTHYFMRKKNTKGEGKGGLGWRVRDRGRRGGVMPDNFSESTKRKEQVTKRL